MGTVRRENCFLILLQAISLLVSPLSGRGLTYAHFFFRYSKGKLLNEPVMILHLLTYRHYCCQINIQLVTQGTKLSCFVLKITAFIWVSKENLPYQQQQYGRILYYNCSWSQSGLAVLKQQGYTFNSTPTRQFLFYYTFSHQHKYFILTPAYE